MTKLLKIQVQTQTLIFTFVIIVIVIVIVILTFERVHLVTRNLHSIGRKLIQNKTKTRYHVNANLNHTNVTKSKIYEYS